MIEEVIVELGLNCSECRLLMEGLPAWGLARGSAEVFIFINENPESGEHHYHVRCISPVMKLPRTTNNRMSLLFHLLELNASELTAPAFGVKGDTVVLSDDHDVQDMDPSEVRNMVLRVGYYADVFDDVLVNEFGGRRHSD